MCAAHNSPTPSSITSNASSSKHSTNGVPTSSTQGSKPVPKWMKMKQQNKSSAGKTAKPTAPKSSGSAQKPQQESRDAKRARWAKRAKPVAIKPVVKRGPVHEYVSVCCSAPAQKPPCGTKVASVDPETGRPAKKDKATGLGHFRCSQCRKGCKVKPQSPKTKKSTPEQVSKLQADVDAASTPEERNAIVEACVAQHQS